MSDRFEEMRSKGTNTNDADAVASDIAMGKTAYVKGKKITGTSSGGGGGDYSAIGTTVTVEAQGAMAKGARWEGVKSEDYEITIGSQNVSAGSASQFSENLEVGIPSTYITTSTISYPIYFFDSQSSSYVEVLVDISEIASKLTENTSAFEISHDGKLAMFTNSTGEYVFLEIDREKRNAVAYYTQLPDLYSNTSYQLFFGNKYICATTSDYKLSFYEYSKATHSLLHVNTINYEYIKVYWSMGLKTPWINPVENIYITTMIQTSSSVSNLVKFTLINGEFQILFSPVTTYKVGQFSSDGKYFSVNTNRRDLTSYKGTVGVYSLNIQDLTYENALGQTISSSLPAIVEGKYYMIGTNIYEIESRTRVAIATQTTAKTTNWCWNPQKFINDQKTKLYCVGSNEKAEYIVTPNLTGATEEGKYYGVASQAMNIGDVGEAQLLFTT